MENIYPPKYNEFINVVAQYELFTKNLKQLESDEIPKTANEMKEKLKFTR
jgi:hypothetical protein